MMTHQISKRHANRIRKIAALEATNADLLEALEYFVQNVIIDKYDACDEPLNTAWDKAREAIRKAKS